MLFRMACGVTLATLVAIGLPGCDDDAVTPPTLGAVEGTVAHVDGNVLEGIGVILVDPATVATASALRRTDATGRYHIDGIAPGDYAVFVYDAGKYGNFARTTALVHVVAGSTTFQHITLIDSGLWRDGPFYVSGTVTDATTGAPVAGAYVSGVLGAGQEDFLFAGATVPDFGVTDEAGRFTISSPGFFDLYGASLGLEPISVTKLGYEPATLVGRGEDPIGFGAALPAPIPPDSVLAVGVAMRRVDPVISTGVLRGRLVQAGTPVMGVQVVLALSGVADPDTVPGLVAKTRGGRAGIETLLPGKTAVTDAAGRFSIAGLHPGRYALHGAARPNDGFVRGGGHRNIEISSDTTNVGDVVVLSAMTPLVPARNSSPPANQQIELQWTPPVLPAGVHLTTYRLWVGTGYIIDLQAIVAHPSVTLEPLPPGTSVRWDVQATGVIEATGDSMEVGGFEEIASFIVAGSAR